MEQRLPLAIHASEAAVRMKSSNYPSPFAERMAGRLKHPLGDLFGLRNFGVNLTELTPGAVSSLLHRHTRQDEFIYVLEGKLTLVTDEGEVVLTPGMCAGFAAGGPAHQIANRSAAVGIYLEIGDRSADDVVSYPADDLIAVREKDSWAFTRKDGLPYE
jgi:uncharacterized cupin superfamily protein